MDRLAAGRLLAALPAVGKLARANRTFGLRAARFCAAEVDQFIDLGPGIPTRPNVDEIAWEVNRNVTVVGVDIDPVVLSHGQALRPGAHLIWGDVRAPERIIPELGRFIDFDEPVALMATSLLNFIPEDPRPILRVFCDVMVPGSLLVISHGTDDGSAPETVAAFQEVYKEASSPAVFRSVDQIAAMFDGLEFIPPGLVDMQVWQPMGIAEPLLGIRMLGGVARVPGA